MGRSRTVTLPKGRWYNFWDDAVVESRQLVTLAASLEQIPLLVKAGSILPMEEDKQLTLHIYILEQENREIVFDIDSGDGYGESR